MSRLQFARAHDSSSFEAGRHHPVPEVAPDIFFDVNPEPAGESATEAFFLWLRVCTHQGETVRPMREIAVRICALVYVLGRGEKAIAEIAQEAGVSRSTLHRHVGIISAETGIRVPRKKLRKQRSS